jgi:hypothetical protein
LWGTVWWQLIEDGPKGPHVCAVIERADDTTRLLGGHVRQASHEPAGLGGAFTANSAHQGMVDDAGDMRPVRIGLDHDVLWFGVAVDETEGLGSRQRVGNGPEDADTLLSH